MIDMNFQPPRPLTTRVSNMDHGDVYAHGGVYYIRSWDGVISLRLLRSEGLYALNQRYTLGHDRVPGEAAVLGTLVIKLVT